MKKTLMLLGIQEERMGVGAKKGEAKTEKKRHEVHEGELLTWSKRKRQNGLSDRPPGCIL